MGRQLGPGRTRALAGLLLFCCCLGGGGVTDACLPSLGGLPHCHSVLAVFNQYPASCGGYEIQGSGCSEKLHMLGTHKWRERKWKIRIKDSLNLKDWSTVRDFEDTGFNNTRKSLNAAFVLRCLGLVSPTDSNMNLTRFNCENMENDPPNSINSIMVIQGNAVTSRSGNSSRISSTWFDWTLGCIIPLNLAWIILGSLKFNMITNLKHFL